MATTQLLTLTQVSQSVLNNTSRVRILWTTTQTGTSYNDYQKVGYYWVSVNGGPETMYTVYSNLPLQSTKTIVDTTIEVPHDQNGDCTVAVRTSMATGISAGTITKSASLELDNLPRSSAITSAANVMLGATCQIQWTPLSTSFRYKLVFSLGNWSYTTGVIHPNKTSVYTFTGYVIPLEVAKQIPNSPTGKMTVTLTTYSDSAATTPIGSVDSETFNVTVPITASPVVSMSLSPVHSLPSAFNGIYVQGISKVVANLSAELKLNASIQSYDMTVEGKTYGAAQNYTSDYLTTPGEVSVVGRAVDSRQYEGRAEAVINVIPYANPKIQNVTAKRCDADGNPSSDGTYLKITAKRNYQPVIVNGVQKNYCQIRYRYKIESGQSYSDWETILWGVDLSSDEVVTAPLLYGNLLATNTYRVEIQAIDDIGNTASSAVIIPTDQVYWHRDGAKNGLGLGKYNEQRNALDSGWDIHMNGHKVTGVADPALDTDVVTLGFLKQYIESRIAELTGG